MPKHLLNVPMTLDNMRPEQEPPDLRQHQRLIIRAMVGSLARSAERMMAHVDQMAVCVDHIEAQLDRIDAGMQRIEDGLIEVATAFRAYCENEQRREQ